MKTFNQLTNTQKIAAIAHAKEELMVLVQEGFLDFGNGDQLQDKSLNYFAKEAAEGSKYCAQGYILKGSL